MKHRVAAIVLAAGLSSRMAPANKLLAPMEDGALLIAHTVRNALASKAWPVIVVTGFQASLVEEALVGLSICLVHAMDFAEGLAASLRTGMAALPSGTEAVLIMLGDMPLVEPALINRLIAAYDPRSGHDIVVPVWQGQRGNPRLLGQQYFNTLKALDGDSGAKRLLNDYPDRIAEIASIDDSSSQDFDTQESLHMLRVPRARPRTTKLRQRNPSERNRR